MSYPRTDVVRRHLNVFQNSFTHWLRIVLSQRATHNEIWSHNSIEASVHQGEAVREQIALDYPACTCLKHWDTIIGRSLLRNSRPISQEMSNMWLMSCVIKSVPFTLGLHSHSKSIIVSLLYGQDIKGQSVLWAQCKIGNNIHIEAQNRSNTGLKITACRRNQELHLSGMSLHLLQLWLPQMQLATPWFTHYSELTESPYIAAVITLIAVLLSATCLSLNELFPICQSQ